MQDEGTIIAQAMQAFRTRVRLHYSGGGREGPAGLTFLSTVVIRRRRELLLCSKPGNIIRGGEVNFGASCNDVSGRREKH